MGNEQVGMTYDIFPFFNELDLLDIRLNVHGPYVDRFVLIESLKTHAGYPKPLYYNENKATFQKFHDRLIHRICGLHGPDGIQDSLHRAWVNERLQRDSHGMEFKPEDIIVSTDLDEIVNFPALGSVDGTYQLSQLMYHYWLNDWRGHWDFGKVTTGRDLLGVGTLTDLRSSRPHPAKENAGWHFSWMGGVDRVQQKLSAFAHQEFNRADVIDREMLDSRMESGRDILARTNEDFWIKRVPISETTHPKYIVDNQSKFAHLIHA